MRLVTAIGISSVLVAITLVQAQEAPSQSSPISAVELKCTGTFMPFSEHMLLHSDARAEWQGTDEPRVGEYVGQTNAYNWERLVKFLDLVQFDQLSSSYGSNGDDVPELVVTVHRGTASRSVTCYGNEGPVKLWAVRMTMRGIADTITWAPAPKEAGK